jgi:hypothetical protein
MSPAPTPVTAMTMPGPAYLNRRPRVDGACVLEAPSSVTSPSVPSPTLANEFTVLDTIVALQAKERQS